MFRSLSAHVKGDSHGKECHPLAGEPAQVTDDRNNAKEQLMKYLQHPTRVVVMCAIGAIAVAASVQQASAQGPPRPVPTVLGAEVTHLGVPLADHVMLVLSSSVTESACGGSLGLRRMSSDGSVEESEFVVPAGRSLVVLDVDAVIVAFDVTFRFPVGSSVGASLVTPSNINTGLLHGAHDEWCADHRSGHERGVGQFGSRRRSRLRTGPAGLHARRSARLRRRLFAGRPD